MKINYVSHACLLIDTGKLKILTDPWVYGPAYCGQWNVFPKPVHPELVSEADVILISHGHEDHLHDATLRRVNKRAKIFYPYVWYGGVNSYFRELGFAQITEASTGKTYALEDEVRVTYLTNNLDSIVVVEKGDEVLVNVNDALHAYPERIIDHFVEEIRSRWPKIDVVFCGFGGASYFPNTVHMQGKDDVAIAKVREQLFVHNFCRIVNGLEPRRAVPFAADFALLRSQQRWINEIRFPREQISDYFHNVYGGNDGIELLAMYPGDVLTEHGLARTSPYRSQMREGALAHLIESQYSEEIAAAQSTRPVTPAAAEELAAEVLANLALRSRLFPASLSKVNYCLRVPDVQGKNCFNIRFTQSHPQLTRADAPDPDAILTVELPSSILRYSFASDWGGDAVTIGYGCEVQIHDPDCLNRNLDLTCLRLLTRHPQASRHWKQNPVRMTRFLLSSPTSRAWAVHAALRPIRPGNDALRKEVQDSKTMIENQQWLRRTKCEICRICDLPLLDENFARTLPDVHS